MIISRQIKIYKKIAPFFPIFIIGIILFSGFQVLAQSQFDPQAELDWPVLGGIKISENGRLVANLPEVVKYFFNFAIIIAGLAAFFKLVVGGFTWMSSGGDPSKIKEARDTISSALIGLLLLLASFLLLQIINPDILILKQLNF